MTHQNCPPYVTCKPIIIIFGCVWDWWIRDCKALRDSICTYGCVEFGGWGGNYWDPFSWSAGNAGKVRKAETVGAGGQGERSQGSPFTFSACPPRPPTRGALIQHNTNSAGLHLRSPKRVNTEHRSSACARREGRDTVNQLHRSAQ